MRHAARRNMIAGSVLASCLATLTGCGNPAPAATYYVDAAAGSDSRTGRSLADAWAHAPGDPQATAGPAGVLLRPGDTVRFRAGVPYRGSIQMRFDGASGAPITYTGAGWGEGRAVIDGADPVLADEPCPSAAACAGAANWSALRLVRFTPGPGGTTELFDDKGQLFEARYPALPDPFWADDIRNYVITPPEAKQAIESGRLENAELAALARDGGPAQRLAFWVWGNLVRYRKIVSVSGDTILFEPASLRIYTGRPGRVALVGSVHALTVPGSYIRLGDGQALAYPRPDGGRLYASTGRPGFDMQSRSHIVIDGFDFVRGSASPSRQYDGLAIRNSGTAVATDWTISNNRFGPAALQSGRGTITLGNVDGVRVVGNRIAGIQTGSGLRAAPRVSRFSFIDNRITRVGRTGLYLAGVEGAEVRGNIVHDIKGVHGNGMSFYLANHNIVVEGNCIFDSPRPITFGGSSAPADAPPNNITIRSNLLIATPDSSYAITAWGGRARGIIISENVALAAKRGLRLHGDDRDVTVEHNVLNGIQLVKGAPVGGVIADNRDLRRSAARGIFTPDYCAMDGYSGPIHVGLPPR
jgi:hypothetical protein